MPLKPGTSTPQTFKVKVKGQLSGGENTVLGTRAELGTSWSLSGPGTGGACLMLQPRTTADLLLLSTRWIFCTLPQPSEQMIANMQGQPASEPPFTSSTDKTRSLNHQINRNCCPFPWMFIQACAATHLGWKALQLCCNGTLSLGQALHCYPN